MKKLEMIMAAESVSADSEKYVLDLEINRRKFGKISSETLKMFGYGWERYMRDFHGYSYQFKVAGSELKTLAAMERNKKLKEHPAFFTGRVISELCSDYLDRVIEVFASTGKVGGRKITPDRVAEHIDMMGNICSLMKKEKSYRRLYGLWKKFTGKMYRLPEETQKSEVWKEAYKLKGVYFTLVDLVKFYGVRVDGLDMAGSLKKLEEMLDGNPNGLLPVLENAVVTLIR